ncbi:universal stress protein [Stieleria varia]|uniref:Universal stress protein n=1 Tax=Stieleria varia TaxID=2528005 RepID=A0A5C6ATQ2_9BACT|nr:universal stress protein [Stieleria varia]TWU02446.1 Universal stress protein [Stieleria varia]
MKVLLATDGSETAKHAAEFLAKMELAAELDVTLATVSHDPADFANAYVPVAEDWKTQERERVATHQAELESILSGVTRSVTLHQQFGTVAHDIVELSQRMQADLVVLGAVGHSMIRRMLLGSVSDYVANHASCSVLIVRPTAELNHGQVNVLIAYDGSLASKQAAEELVGLPWKAEPAISVLSVVQEYDVLLGDGISAVALSDQTEWFERMRGENQSMTDQIAHQMKGAEAHVTKGYHVGDAIVDYAEKHKSDLIVVGDSGHSVIEDLLLGSTSKFIMRHAPCSVWISRHHRNTNNTTSELADNLST